MQKPQCARLYVQFYSQGCGLQNAYFTLGNAELPSQKVNSSPNRPDVTADGQSVSYGCNVDLGGKLNIGITVSEPYTSVT